MFLADDGLLIGYFQTDSLEAAQAGMAASEVNARRQAQMAPFFRNLDGVPDTGFARLPEAFHLGEQLAREPGVARLTWPGLASYPL